MIFANLIDVCVDDFTSTVLWLERMYVPHASMPAFFA
jgi:hypothetical protein